LSPYSPLFNFGSCALGLFIARPGGRVVIRWAKRVTGLAVRSEEDISVLFEELGSAASRTGKELEESGSKVKAFNKEISNVKKDLEEVGVILREFKEKTGVDAFESFRKTYERAANAFDSISKSLQSQDESQKKIIGQQQSLLEQNQKVLDGYKQELIRQTTQRDDAEKRAKAIIQENTALISRLDKIRAVIKDLARNL